MASLLFILTFLFLIALFVIVIIRAIRKRPITSTVKTLGYTIGAYAMVWLIFYIIRSKNVIPLNTDICFDDWCATVTQIDHDQGLQQELGKLPSDSIYLVLHVTMSNHARGIAQ